MRAKIWVGERLPADGPSGPRDEAEYNNILLIAATNRGDSLDPALLRPGRFDRRLYFDVPTKAGRRDLIDFFLDRKSHHQQLDDPTARAHRPRDVRLHAGDDRAPLRRGPAGGAPRRAGAR